MSYVNLPASLQVVFIDLNNRLAKLENAQRFTVPIVPVVITAASGNGTTITYTAKNVFVPGQAVTIAGLSVASGASLNFPRAVVASASYTQFTVTDPTVGVASGQGQAIVYAPVINGLNDNDPLNPRSGDMWVNSQSNVLKFIDAFGSSRSVIAPYLAINSTGSLTATTSLDLWGNQFLEGNKIYEIEVLVQFTSLYSTTTSHQLNIVPGFTGTTNYYNSEYLGASSSAAGASQAGYSTAVTTSMVAAPSANQSTMTGVFKMWGIVSTSSQGFFTMALNASTGTNLTSVSVGAGSYLKLTPVASSRVTNGGSYTPQSV